MMYWTGTGMSGWGMALMGAGTAAFWALVVIAVVALVRTVGRWPGEGRGERPNAEDVLAERFARGEIDEGTYRQDLETLHRLHRPALGG